jgi:putative ABC transport system ATP-binding protein
MSETRVLNTSQLSHRYAGERGERIVFPDLVLNAGSLLIVRGASGSGKSTLLHLLAGARRLDEGAAQLGRIDVLGRDVSQLSAAQRDALRPATIGWIPQRVHLIDSLNVIDNIVLPIALAGGAQQRLTESAYKRLERAGLSHLARAKSTELSVGQAARCCVIRALIAEPKLLLADEPSAALDKESARVIAELLGEYCAAGGSAVVATHDNEFQLQLRSVCHDLATDIELGGA